VLDSPIMLSTGNSDDDDDIDSKQMMMMMMMMMMMTLTLVNIKQLTNLIFKYFNYVPLN